MINFFSLLNRHRALQVAASYPVAIARSVHQPVTAATSQPRLPLHRRRLLTDDHGSRIMPVACTKVVLFAFNDTRAFTHLIMVAVSPESVPIGITGMIASISHVPPLLIPDDRELLPRHLASRDGHDIITHHVTQALVSSIPPPRRAPPWCVQVSSLRLPSSRRQASTSGHICTNSVPSTFARRNHNGGPLL